jgi:putative ABC transport system permease protein
MTVLSLLRQALRMTARDWRAGELRLLGAALVIAVAAVSSVGFFVDRIRLGLERDATQLIGADLVINSDRPINSALRERARSEGLTLAETVIFPSMAISERNTDDTALAAVKAVSAGYPLRGSLRVQESLAAADVATRAVPAPGRVWLDAQALQALRLQVGDRLRLGERSFLVDRIIAIEPDRGAQFINFAPRVMLHLDDLSATQLIQPGSRVAYRLLIAGDTVKVRAFSAWIAGNLERGQRVESLEGGGPKCNARSSGRNASCRSWPCWRR